MRMLEMIAQIAIDRHNQVASGKVCNLFLLCALETFQR